MRWDSPFVLATAGTLAVHLVLLVMADAITVYNPYRPAPPAPRIEMVEIEVPPAIIAEPPPPVAPPEPVKQPDPPPQPKVVAKTQVKSTPVATQPEPVRTEPPPVADPSAVPGGDQVVTLDSAQTGGIGVPVAVGKRTSERVGRGGQGGGTGSGSGSGAAAEAPRPMSVATIKKRAMPKGDYGYFDAGRDYPPEARQQGIEGPIRVRLLVDDKGKVVTKVLLNKLGHGLDELALKRAGEIEFDPALDSDDRAVSSVVIWTFNMTLPK